MCGAVMEKDLTLDVARRVDRLLDSQGIATLMPRVGDTYASLADRAAPANRPNHSIFIPMHLTEANNPAASGVETFYVTLKVPPDPPLASWLPFFSRPPSGSPN